MRYLRIVIVAIALSLLNWLPGSLATPVAAQSTYPCASATGLPQTECEALVALYHATDGENWKENANWLATTTPCGWYGVSCFGGHVWSLALYGNRLSGALPPELRNLTSLYFLGLGQNQLNDSLPPELGNLTALSYMVLSRNELSGAIPVELGNLTSLEELDLANNELSGGIPPELGNITSLKTLNLASNQLSGPIPDSMTSLSNLDSLSFHLTALCIPSAGPVGAWLDTIDDVDGTSFICEEQPGSIGGTVRSPDSDPLPGIRVDLYRRTASGDFRHVTVDHTDHTGAYRFFNLRNDTNYTIRFLDPAQTYATEYYDDARTVQQAKRLPAPAGTWRSDIDAVLAMNEETPSAYLPLLNSHPSPVAWNLTPFDATMSDLSGPRSWSARYGKTPEIIVSTNGRSLDVLAQDYDAATPWRAVLLHIEPDANRYVVTQALTDFPMLDRIMGLAADEDGNRYYATAVDESDAVDPGYPPLDTYRNDIVRVVKLNPAGGVLFNVDLDIARRAFHSDAEMIINPMTFATARLAVGDSEIALVHSINTDPDWNINGSRHQKALSTRLSAESGFIRRTSSVWVSHSFDQRLFYDGEGIIEHHLGDAFPRYVVFGRDHDSYPLFHIKGEIGANETSTRLGNLALIENDPHYRYIALFATENSAELPSDQTAIAGPRNLAIVRVKNSDNSIDPNLPDVLTVDVGGTAQTNRLRWLTHYSDASNKHAERPKLIGIGGDRYVVLWEEWLVSDDWADTFNGVHAMVIDDKGNTIHGDRRITDQYHLHRGDDAFLLDNRAAWMTGSSADKTLQIHFVDGELNYEMVTLASIDRR